MNQEKQSVEQARAAEKDEKLHDWVKNQTRSVRGPAAAAGGEPIARRVEEVLKGVYHPLRGRTVLRRTFSADKIPYP